MVSIRHAQLEVDLPPGWEGRAFSRLIEVTERNYSVLHLANFALPAEVEDYGGGAVERLRAADVFLALLEFGPESLGTALFSPAGVPRLTSASFDTNRLQRGIAGQSGAQAFFTANGRPYSLYVVLGQHLNRFRAVPAINEVLRGIQFVA